MLAAAWADRAHGAAALPAGHRMSPFLSLPQAKGPPLRWPRPPHPRPARGGATLAKSGPRRGAVEDWGAPASGRGADGASLDLERPSWGLRSCPSPIRMRSNGKRGQAAERPDRGPLGAARGRGRASRRGPWGPCEPRPLRSGMPPPRRPRRAAPSRSAPVNPRLAGDPAHLARLAFGAQPGPAPRSAGRLGCAAHGPGGGPRGRGRSRGSARAASPPPPSSWPRPPRGALARAGARARGGGHARSRRASHPATPRARPVRTRLGLGSGSGVRAGGAEPAPPPRSAASDRPGAEGGAAAGDEVMPREKSP